MHKLALICGGLSQERGISLNSARSFLDHTYPFDIELSCLYVNPKGSYYQLSAGQLYSNTPSDFDFKLEQEQTPLTEKELLSILREADLVFPLIHGIYGEDGTLQRLLERCNIPYAGSSSWVCQSVFNKRRVREAMQQRGFSVLPYLAIQGKDILSIERFWKENHLTEAILKPTESGSSIGVTYVDTVEKVVQSLELLEKKGFREFLLEPYCRETEFTVCVLQNQKKEAVSLIPLEIDIGKRSGDILDYRKKYLPSDKTRYYCPPRFEEKVCLEIQKKAEKLFQELELCDFARIDGWISKEGEIWFSEINPISGMEQNSFLFQQAAKIGMSHVDLIGQILQSAFSRHGKKVDILKSPDLLEKVGQEPVYILMGGNTSERQVSLMSGTNVWLKILRNPLYAPVPFLLDQQKRMWQLPYSFTLHHTVEEMTEQCELAQNQSSFFRSLSQGIREKLGLKPFVFTPPLSMSLMEFIQKAKEEEAFVFLALHGGLGEDGTLQRLLEEQKIPFNGSSSRTSHLCMDKYASGLVIGSLAHSHIAQAPQISFYPSAYFSESDQEIKTAWKKASKRLKTEDLLIKPQFDGCSTGVLRLASEEELCLYIRCLQERKKDVSAGTFVYQQGILEMPLFIEGAFLLERYVHTDKIVISETTLNYEHVTGWCEITIGVLEREGIYTALNPSITVAESGVLSLEEKFQGGTGVNITPPPKNILSPKALDKIRESACLIAKELGIENYCRLDLFVRCETGDVQFIEANTLPGLTPSTVLYHQALSQSPPIFPHELLGKIIESGKNKAKTVSR